METHCNVNFMKDISTMPNIDARLKLAAAELKVGATGKTGPGST